VEILVALRAILVGGAGKGVMLLSHLSSARKSVRSAEPELKH